MMSKSTQRCLKGIRLIIPRPDVLVLGFQEIVPLTAQQIVQTDPEKRSVPYAEFRLDYAQPENKKAHMGECHHRDS